MRHWPVPALLIRLRNGLFYPTQNGPFNPTLTVIINLLKEGHSYTFIEDITSCSAAQIDALAKELGLKPGDQENAVQASNSHS